MHANTRASDAKTEETERGRAALCFRKIVNFCWREGEFVVEHEMPKVIKLAPHKDVPTALCPFESILNHCNAPPR